jgi:dihydrofolate synthase / folylpolyglutamate synthase
VAQSPLEYLFGLEQFGIKFGLDNIRTLVAALDHPDRAYRIAHIAGTNGKGSVTAIVDTAVRAAGYRTGRYTSPHLVDLAERFVIDGSPVDAERLERAASRLRELVDILREDHRLSAPPTFFEATTAIALMLFRESGVEIATCEVGLGGRLDATNVLSPIVTAITSIGHDHTRYLGSTLPQIAGEKAGIIKPGVPVIVGALPSDALDVVTAVARERSAPICLAADESIVTDEGPVAEGGHRLRLRTNRRDYGTVTLALAGTHQVGNALVAVQVLEAIEAAGIGLSVDSIRHGLEAVRWPGRLDHRRLANGRELLLDAAHNPEGAQALAAYLSFQGHEPLPLVFGAMKDKDITAMIRALAPHARPLVLTRAQTSRSAEPSDLAIVAHEVGVTCPVMVEPDLETALHVAWRTAPRIVVAGSIFLLGDVMRQLALS